MKIFWTRPAQHDLNAIFAYIARDNAHAALKLCDAVEEKVRALSTNSAIGRPGRVDGTRELVITGMPYIVPYRVRADYVEILAVLHAARKWPESFE